MLGNNVVDYMINSCKGAYNLENAKLIKKKCGRQESSVCIQEK